MVQLGFQCEVTMRYIIFVLLFSSQALSSSYPILHGSKTAGTVLAGPVSPSPATAPTFRAITVQDLPYNLVSKATNYTATNADETIVFTADATLTLPTAVGITGKKYHVVASGSGVDITIDPNGSETVCGKTTIYVGQDGDEVTIQSNGTNWIGLENSCYRNEFVYFGGGASGGIPTSTCSGSPCTMAANSPAITGVTRSGAGTYAVAFATGTFSSGPSAACLCGLSGVASNGFSAGNATSTSAATVYCYSTAISLTDNVMSCSFVGPR